MARQYIELWSLGVSSYAWYDWENNNGYWQFGRLWDSNNNGLNAAGVAYTNLYNWMVGAKMSQSVSSNGSVYTCGFTRPGGYQALAAWNTNRTSTSSFTFTVPSGYVQYRDLAGNLYTEYRINSYHRNHSDSARTILTAVTSNSVTPVFSGLTSHTSAYGILP